MLRLHRFILALHAPAHRRRHAAAVDGLVRKMVAACDDEIARRRLLRSACRDASRTLMWSWRDAVRSPVARRRRLVPALEAARTDCALALRHHRRRPIYATVAVMTLALAVGANTAIYSVADAALFRSLPYASPDRVVQLHGTTAGVLGGDGLGWAPSELLRTTPGIGAAGIFIPGGGASLVADDSARRISVAQVGPEFFEVLGVELVIGAGFSVEDRDTVVLGHSVWVQQFGADRDVLGRTIRLAGISLTVVGVAPAEVTFPGETEAWVPTPLRWAFYSDATGPTLFARLEPVADRGAVEELLASRTTAERTEMAEAIQEEEVPPVRLIPLRDRLTAPVKVPLIVLSGAAALVFLLGCLNLAGVAESDFLRRAASLRVRVSLGATSGRLRRQIIAESLVLSAAGCVAGLAVGAAGVRVLLAWLPGEVPGMSNASIGRDAIAIAAGLSIVAAVLINLIPLLQLPGLADFGRSNRGASRSRGQARVRAVLTVAQVAVTVLLLVGAGLLGRSLVGIASVPIGIDTESVLTFEAQVSTTPRGENESEDDYDARTRAARDVYLQDVLDRVAAMPRVRAVGAVSQLPLSEGLTIGTQVRRLDDPPETEGVSVSRFEVTPGYSDGMGIPVLAGQTFSRYPLSAEEVVLSRRTITELLGGIEHVGETVLIGGWGGDWTPVRVVGVVDDIRYRGPESDPRAMAYVPLEASLDQAMGFAIRLEGEPTSFAQSLRAELAAIDARVPPYNLQTTGQALSRQISSRRALALVSGLFAIIAVVLATIGIFGLIAESVALRRREIGIRIALGARIPQLVAAVTWNGCLLAAAGVVLAMPIALWASPFLVDVLFDIGPRDVAVMLLAPVLLLAVSAVASWLPARRAAAVDPVAVLAED